jgi:hypothetical protein
MPRVLVSEKKRRAGSEWVTSLVARWIGADAFCGAGTWRAASPNSGE